MAIQDFSGYPVRESAPRGNAFMDFARSVIGRSKPAQADKEDSRAPSEKLAPAPAKQTATGVQVAHLGKTSGGKDRLLITAPSEKSTAGRTMEIEVDADKKPFLEVKDDGKVKAKDKSEKAVRVFDEAGTFTGGPSAAPVSPAIADSIARLNRVLENLERMQQLLNAAPKPGDRSE